MCVWVNGANFIIDIKRIIFLSHIASIQFSQLNLNSPQILWIMLSALVCLWFVSEDLSVVVPGVQLAKWDKHPGVGT